MRITSRSKKLLVDAYYICVLMLSTTAFVSVLVPIDEHPRGGGSPLLKLMWGIVSAISVLSVYRRREVLVPMLRANRPLLFLNLFVLSSWLWSIERPATLHFAATLIFSTIFVLDFCLRYPLKRQLELLCIGLLTLSFLSLVCDIFFPSIIPAQTVDGGAWHGVFGAKNNLGRATCLTVIACLTLSRRSWLFRSGVIAGGLVITVLSRSASSVGYTLLLLAVLSTWSILKWKPKPRLAGILILSFVSIAAAVYVSQDFVGVLAMMNKDPHMTGRVDLWEFSIDYIQKRPILGYGYGAFWSDSSQQARRIREAVHWDEAPHAHNGYIDMFLSGGWVGFLAFIVTYCISFCRALRYFMRTDETYGRWPLTYLVFVLVYQFTENSIINGNNLPWILFCSIALSIGQPQKEESFHASRQLYPVPA